MSRRFALGTATYLAANVLNAAIPFALMPVLTRVLTPSDYGALSMFTIFVTVMGAVTGLSMHGAVGVRYFQLDSESFSRYLGACLKILCIATLACVALTIIGASWIESVTQLPVRWLAIGTAIAGANVVTMICLTIWQMQQRAVRYAVLLVTQSVVNMALSVVLVVAIGLGWEGRALAHSLTILFFTIVALYLLNDRRISRDREGKYTGDILRFGLPLIPHVIGGLAIGMTDRLMVANMVSLADAGIYTIALQIGMGLSLLTDSFNRAYAPWLTGLLAKSDRTRDTQIVRGTYLYFIVVAGLAVLLGAVAPWLLSFVVGSAFRGASSSIFYIGMGFAFGGMYYMVTNYVFFRSRTATLAMITLGAGALNIASTWYLIKLNGAVGAAQAFMISQAVLFIGTWVLAQRCYPMPWFAALALSSSKNFK